MTKVLDKVHTLSRRLGEKKRELRKTSSDLELSRNEEGSEDEEEKGARAVMEREGERSRTMKLRDRKQPQPPAKYQCGQGKVKRKIVRTYTAGDPDYTTHLPLSTP